jgi:HEAT repeat protein
MTRFAKNTLVFAAVVTGIWVPAKTAEHSPHGSCLASRIRNGDRNERIAAMKCVGRSGHASTAVAQALDGAAKDTDIFVRRWAVYSLGSLDIPPERVLPLLKEALSERDVSLRVYAAISICAIAPDSKQLTVPVLSAALWNGNPEIQARAADLLGSMGAQASDAVPYLAAVVHYNSLDGVRPWDADDFVYLPPVTNTEKPTVHFVNAALLEQGAPLPTASPNVIIRTWDFRGAECMHDVPRLAALEALGKMGQAGRGASPFVRDALLDQDPVIRDAAQRILAKISTDSNP